MSRSGKSVWKLPYINPIFWNRCKSAVISSEITSTIRNTTIVPIFEGMTFNIYNGRKKDSVFVTEEMKGLKLGELSLTKTIGSNKGKKKGKKKKR